MKFEVGDIVICTEEGTMGPNTLHGMGWEKNKIFAIKSFGNSRYGENTLVWAEGNPQGIYTDCLRLATEQEKLYYNDKFTHSQFIIPDAVTESYSIY